MIHKSARNRYSALALLILAPLLLQLLPVAARAAEFDRPTFSLARAHQLLTCHWAHWSIDHLAWSGGAFAILALACAVVVPRRLMPCIALSSISVGLAVWLGTDLTSYRGLSGIDSALFTLLAAHVLRDGFTRGGGRAGMLALGLLLGFAAKLTFEAATGRAIFVAGEATGMVAVPLAHLVGAATGAGIAITPVARPTVKRVSARAWSSRPLAGR